MRKIKWLHIADLHMNKADVDTRRMRYKLLEYLQNQGIKCEYVFFTGDLRFAPDVEFSSEALEYIRQVCQCVQVPLTHLFIVPGNHDISRDEIPRLNAISRIYSGTNASHTGYYSPANGHIASEDLASIAHGKNGFCQAMKELFADEPQKWEPFFSNNPHFLAVTDDLNLVLVDASITYTKEHERDLILGTELLMDLLEKLDKTKPTLVLSHYSYDFLDREEQNHVFQLLVDNQVQLWLSGHEHGYLARKQRDYFYEFQCGSLIHENNTRNCILLGELDLDNGTGFVQAHAWNSPEGWSPYPFASAIGENRDQYEFQLRTDTEKEAVSIVESGFTPRAVGEDIYAINLYKLNQEILDAANEMEVDEMRYQLGDRIQGNECRDVIISLFLAEVKMTLNSNKRHGCMPMFQNVVRNVFDGYLYVNKDIAPIDRCRITQFFYNDYDEYLVAGEKYQIAIQTYKESVLRVQLGYTLSDETDVNSRLLYFQKIGRIVNASSLRIKFQDEEKHSLIVGPAFLLRPEFQEEKQLTEYWIDQMERVAEIEQYYAIKFILPTKASEDDYIGINIISDSIRRKCCITFPQLPMEKKLFYKEMKIEKEIPFGDAKRLPKVSILGFHFEPIKQYIIPCRLFWSKKKKGWKTKAGGVPTGVEFRLVESEDWGKGKS